MYRSIQTIIQGQPTSDGAGVSLSRIIGQAKLQGLDPFLMLDEFKSANKEDYLAGFPTHPHRGFETVTYMLAGRMRHQDNQGNEGVLEPGSIQWMTAGRGILHSEMPEQEDGFMHGFQLWVNLPAKDKMTTPRYQDIPPQNVPTVDLEKGQVKVLAGEFQGVQGPVEGGFVQPQYLDVTLLAEGDVVLPMEKGHQGFVYVFEGSLMIGSQSLQTGQLGVLKDGEAVHLASLEGGRAIVVSAKPLNEPIAKYGPFVMNTPEEIMQAFRDFQEGKF